MATTAAARRGARARTEALAEQLYATHRSWLLAVARNNSDDPEEAEEALQDAFIVFIDRFDPDGGSPPLPWITLTLKRRCWVLYQRQRRSFDRADLDNASQLNLAPGFLTPSNRLSAELLEVAEEIATLRAHLRTLKPAERRALGLLALGYSYREICELTGWTYTKVNRCLAEGRARLRELEAHDRTAGHLLDV